MNKLMVTSTCLAIVMVLLVVGCQRDPTQGPGQNPGTNPGSLPDVDVSPGTNPDTGAQENIPVDTTTVNDTGAAGSGTGSASSLPDIPTDVIGDNPDTGNLSDVGADISTI
jgi:hypothetical protein